MIDQATTRVVLIEQSDDHAVFAIPGTNYRLHLTTPKPLDDCPGDRVHGAIRCNVWKVDTVSPGGAYIEPVYGRPRRVQGRVVANDPSANTIVVEVCRCPILAVLPDRWRAADIPTGARVGLDIHEGAAFTPA